MGRVLGIDYGERRIGLALSDRDRKMALPFKMIERKNRQKSWPEEIKQALFEYLSEIDEIVVGLPLLMKNEEGERATLVKAFAKQLQDFLGKPVVLWDERLSSLQADRALQELSLNRKKRTEKLDMVAATIILQGYLDSKLFSK
jgi:putative Holliday junction resolvase